MQKFQEAEEQGLKPFITNAFAGNDGTVSFMSREGWIRVYSESGDGRTFILDFETGGDFTLFNNVKQLTMVYARLLDPELLYKVKEDHAETLSAFDGELSNRIDLERKVEALQRACNIVF